MRFPGGKCLACAVALSPSVAVKEHRSHVVRLLGRAAESPSRLYLVSIPHSSIEVGAMACNLHKVRCCGLIFCLSIRAESVSR